MNSNAVKPKIFEPRRWIASRILAKASKDKVPQGGDNLSLEILTLFGRWALTFIEIQSLVH